MSDSPVSRIQKDVKTAEIVEVLRTIYDPEIPVNIYDLGLVYGVHLADDGNAHIRMTLTSPACPVAGSLPPQVERAVAGITGVTGCQVEVVWDPPWSPDRISEAARLQLGID